MSIVNKNVDHMSYLRYTFLSEYRLVMIQKLKMNYLITLNYHNTKYMIEIDMREILFLRYFLGNNDNSIILKLQKTIPEIVVKPDGLFGSLY